MAAPARFGGGARPWVVVPLCAAVVLVAAPWLGMSTYWMRQVELIALLALLVASLNLISGYAGEFSVGQIALYAAGAYLAGYFAVHGSADILLAILLGALVAPLVGVIAGIPGLRLGGWAFGMVTFFLVLLVPDLIRISWFAERTGGALGLLGMKFPTLFGRPLDERGYYVVVVVTAVLWYGVFRNLVLSRHGSALLVLKESPVLAAALGMPVYRMKLTAYVVAAIPAGMAGALFAHLDHFIAPESFNFHDAVLILAASVLGGATSIYGGLAGAALLQLGPQTISTFKEWSLVVYGVFLMVGGVALSQGVAGLARQLAGRVLPTGWTVGVPDHVDAGDSDDSASPATVPDLDGAALTVRGVSKHFGGVQALQDVTFSAEPGRVTALIGPNGSGKTTMLNVVCGFVAPDQGEVRVGDAVLTGLKPHQVARRGVARTFQTPIIPAHLTTRQVVAAARYRHRPTWGATSVLRLPSHFRAERQDRDAARQALSLARIGHLRGGEAGSLPLGTRRLVELARALAARPKVLLLDEVASGLDEHELRDLAGLIRALRDAGCTIVLVEHNVRLVLELADTIHVLARGSVIASGPPDEIAAHPEVLREYLGTAVEAVEAVEAGGAS